MAAGTTQDDITVTLDNLFTGNKIEKLIPTFSDSWRELRDAPSKNINAKGAFYMVQTQQPNRIVAKPFAAADGIIYPQPSKSKYMVMNVAPITDLATIEWTGNVDVQNTSALKERPAKELDYVENEMEGLLESYGKDKSRQLWQNRTNELARISAVDIASSVITCNNIGNLFNVQLLEDGRWVDIYDAGSVYRCTVNVLTVNRSTKSFTFDPLNILDANGNILGALPGTVANNDRIYPQGSKDNGWAGVSYLTDTTGPFQGTSDRTVHGYLTGMKIDAQGRALSAALLRRLLSGQRFRRNGARQRGKFYASSQIDAYESTGIATQRYGQTRNMDLGYDDDEMKFAGKSFVWDFYVPRDRVFYADLSQIDKFELRKFTPVKDQAGYKRMVPVNGSHKDAWQIHFKGIGNLGTEVPSFVGMELYNLSTAGLAVGDE